jgi:hypothetical protein
MSHRRMSKSLVIKRRCVAGTDRSGGLIPDAVRLRLDCVSRSVRGTITKRGG